MSEFDRINLLTKEMVFLWAWCWEHKTDVRGLEAERTQDEPGWNQQICDLKDKLVLFLDVGQPALEDLKKSPGYSRLVWLAVLDQVLPQYRLDLAGTREPLPVMPIDEKMTWLVFLRYRPLGKTVHKEQRFHIRNHLLHHCIIPTMVEGDEIEVETYGWFLHQGLKGLVKDRRPLRCYLGSFADGIQPDWNGMPSKKCTCSKLKDPSVRLDSLYQALEEARGMRADVVVLPELSLCPGLRGEVSSWLKNNTHPFCMVIPGSFHERHDSEGIPVNRTRLLDGRGREVMFHDKMIPYGTDKDCDEVIRPGKGLRLLNTPMGLVALAICRDFLEEDESMALPWQKIAPDWVFVPSMTPIQGIRSHEVRARILSNCCRTRSLVPNQSVSGIYESVHVEESDHVKKDESLHSLHGFASWSDEGGDFKSHHVQPSLRLVVIPV